MQDVTDRMVPKVHPVTRAVGEDDPMELYATPVSGDPDAMLRCFVQEYAWMGWDAEQILGLFHDPCYPALNGLLYAYGPSAIRSRITSILAQTGVFRFEGYVREDPVPESDEHDLIELGVPLSWRDSNSQASMESGADRPKGAPYA